MNSKINCLIIHGCPGTEEASRDYENRGWEKHWIPWVKEQLISQGISVINPSMPKPWSPNYLAFKEEFEKYPVNGDSVLIGHSCGSAFLVRWLGDSKQKVAKLILVAPWKIPGEGNATRLDFYNYLIDTSVKDRVGEIIMFTADDEEPEGKESLKIFKAALGGRVISLENHGHYTVEDMGTNEFPELVAEILK